MEYHKFKKRAYLQTYFSHNSLFINSTHTYSLNSLNHKMWGNWQHYTINMRASLQKVVNKGRWTSQTAIDDNNLDLSL